MEPQSIEELNKELEECEKKLKGAQLEEATIQALREYKGEDKIISFKKYIEEVGNTKVSSFSSGYRKLDNYIEGFHKGDLITVTALTGQGKTTFCQNLTMKMSEKGIRTLWFSYEMPIPQFLQKFGDTIPEGYLPRVLLDRSMLWIERKIVEGISKYNTSVVFIDHLHYLFQMSTSRNPSLEIGEIMRNLKIIARKYDITIFIIAHTQKIKVDEVLGIDSIRDSSFVGQESDYVIAVQRAVVEKQTKRDMRENGVMFTNESKISVLKNRYTGRLGTFKVYYKDNRFYEELENAIN